MKHTEDNKNKEYKIYDKNTRLWFEVTKEEYEEYDKRRTYIRVREQYHGRCVCPLKKWWYCDGVCQDCEYHTGDDILSWEVLVENAHENNSIKLDTESEFSIEFESKVCNRVAVQQLAKDLEKIMPGAKKLLSLRLKDFPDTDIAKELKMPRTTMLSRLKKALSKLNTGISDFI